jgi:hypothetical protein
MEKNKMEKISIGIQTCNPPCVSRTLQLGYAISYINRLNWVLGLCVATALRCNL